MRIDKWLWAARFFKTRSIAARACELGRVLGNGQPAKPARAVKPGDMLRVTNAGGVFELAVLGLSEMRGPAAAARELYRETEASIESRKRAAEERRLMPQFVSPGDGRPSKRDRRIIEKWRGRA